MVGVVEMNTSAPAPTAIADAAAAAPPAEPVIAPSDEPVDAKRSRTRRGKRGGKRHAPAQPVSVSAPAAVIPAEPKKEKKPSPRRTSKPRAG